MAIDLKSHIESGEQLTREDFEDLASSGKAIKDVFELSDEDMTVFQHLGYDLYNQGRLEDAQTMFEGLLSLGDTDPYILNAMGAIQAQKGELETALAFFDQSLAAEPDEIHALTNRAELFLKLNRFDDAATDL